MDCTKKVNKSLERGVAPIKNASRFCYFLEVLVMEQKKEKVRFGVTTKQIFGNVTHTSFNGVHTMSTVMPMGELLRTCSLDLLPSHLKSMYSEIQRITSPQRRNGFEDYCFKHLTNSIDVGGVVPPVLIGCMSAVKFELSNEPRTNDVITVQPERNFIVDGLNRLSTAAMVLGECDNSLIKKSVDSDARRQRRTKLSVLFENLSVQVVFIFRKDRALDANDFSQIFADVNGQQQPMSTNKLMKLTRADEVVVFARELGSLPIIESHGGMSIDSSRVSDSSEFIITLNTLTRFVLGALGGYKLQSKVRGVREMADGGILTKKHINQIKGDLSLFLETWIENQGDRYSDDRTGFQVVTTLVQALGLVFHKLWNTCADLLPAERTNIIYQTAKALGKLDYSRRAEHWHNCACVALTEDGSYKVVTGGASSRVHFAKHLLSKVGVSYALDSGR